MKKTITGFALSTLLFALGVAVDAQQSKKVPRIGILRPGSAADSDIDPFRQGLRELGYVEGEKHCY
jgi:hypothetical protein